MPSHYQQKKIGTPVLSREAAGRLNGQVPSNHKESPELAGLHASVVLVTPEMAAKWLERNHPQNRPISWKRVEAMANDMRTPGAWKLTHQAVAFDAGGVLLDGQHRLQAVVTAQVAVRMLVVRNEGGSFHDPIDRGTSRSISLLMGQSTRSVAALVILRMLEEGCYSSTPMTLAEGQVALAHHGESLEKLNEHVPGFYKMSGGVQAACVWALPCGEHHVFSWARQVISGEMIKRGDPAFAFRTWQDANRKVGGWSTCMAALSCVRYAIHEKPIKSVYTGDWGLRSITSRRRALKCKYTPSADMVPGGHWGIADREDQG